MKLIINTTNLKFGGALQVATSFIYECINIPLNEYHVFLSPTLEKEVCRNHFPSNFIFYSFDNPSVFIVFCKVIKALQKAESKINPDCVFSVFGPTYWRPKSVHIMGFANALYLYSSLPYIKNMDLFNKVKLNVKKKYHQILLKREANFYIVQTNSMKLPFSKFINKPIDVIDVVPNQHSSIYKHKYITHEILPEKKNGEFWFITISALYPHKNLQIINKLIPDIKNNGMDIKFILTINPKEFSVHFPSSSEYIVNLGPLTLEQCPYVYSMSDALFLPTLVESYSASYPEAMIMKLPILTSNYSFAKDVCGNAALYFDPLDKNDIMRQIQKVYNEHPLRKSMVEKGLKIVKAIPSSKNRAEKYLNICKDCVKNV